MVSSMRYRLIFKIRRFDEPKDRPNSGYYDPLNYNKTGKVDINLDDPIFEQMMTIFHEVCHHVLDLFARFKVDKENRKIIKRDDDLKDDWILYNEKCVKRRKDNLSREEIICMRVERAVGRIIKDMMPKKFFKRFFGR